MKQVVVSLDQGSSSSRVLAFDSRGKAVARAQRAVKMRFPKPGWVEQDPESLVRTLETSLDEVLAELGPRTEIAAVGFAAQRSTIVLWDAKTGRPLLPAFSWMDGRAASVVAGLMDRQHDVHRRTGLYLTPYYSAPKIRWALDRDSKLRALADKGRLRIGPITTYALWKWTRGEVFAVDPAMAQRMLLFNIESGDWDDTLLALFAIPREALPEIVPTTGPWAAIRRKGRVLRLGAVMGDQQSAAYGQGGGVSGSGVLNYGTGAFFLLHTGERLHHIPGILTSVAWQRGGRRRSYFLEGTVHAAGTSYGWLKDNLGLLPDVRAVDAACRRSTQRIFALQAIGGLGAPRWDYDTPTVLMGLDSNTRPEDVVRGVTESLAFFIADIVDAIRTKGIEVRSLRASGGLASIHYLLQFQADMLRQPIVRLREQEATALGVASMAAQEAGLPWAERLCGGGRDREFRPAMPAQEADALLKAWRLFVECQRKTAAELRALGFLRR
ncbi:MAG: FGGY family carbohydrate kinase [Elusimicrobiota bacterium]